MYLNRFFSVVGLQFIIAVAVYGGIIKVGNPGNDNDIGPLIQQAVEAAADGDIIVLPKGSFTIIDRVDIHKRISMIGQGGDENGTVLYRPESLSDAIINYQSMFYISLDDQKPSNILIAKIYFRGKKPCVTTGDGGSLAADIGLSIFNCVDFIVTGCRFEFFGFAGLNIKHYDNVARGLVYNNKFIHNAKGPDALELGYGICIFGNNQMWLEDPNFGSENFIFVEDNYFDLHRHAIAGGGAGLYVFRNNYVLNNLWGHAIDAHEARGSGDNTYSTRAIEAYDNMLINTKFADFADIIPDQNLNRMVGWAIMIRGGEGVIYNNLIQGYLHAFGLITFVNDYPNTYPIPYQIGYQSAVKYSTDHSGYNSDYAKGDVFIWDNTYEKYANSEYCTYLEVYSKDFIKENRDYHLIQKPGYTPYVYPHPSRQIAQDKLNTLTANSSIIRDQVLSVNDTSTENQVIGRIEVEPAFAAANLRFYADGADYSDVISINEFNGGINLVNQNNLKQQDEMLVEVEAFDPEYRLLGSKATLTIKVEHSATPEPLVNSPPVSEDQSFVIFGDDPDPLVGTFLASDPDENQTLTYSIEEGNEASLFTINNVTGEIFISDLEEIQPNKSEVFNLTILVRDNALDNKEIENTAQISIISKTFTFYIDPANLNDINEDGSIEHPFDSWQDVEWIEGAYYLQKAGSIGNEEKIIIEADHVTLGSYGEGEHPVIQSGTSTFLIRAYEKRNVTIRDLHIIAPNAVAGIYFLGETTDSIFIDHCTINGSACGIKTLEGKKLRIQYNTFENCQYGITSYSENVEIFYNIFNNNLTAIELLNSSTNCQVYNNVFFGNENGITSFAGLTLFNNIFYLKETGDKAFTIKFNDVYSDYNIFYPEQTAFVEINGNKYDYLNTIQSFLQMDLNSIFADPVFEDTEHDNFALQPNSPAIDKGKNVGIMMDIQGLPVPYGGITDIGIFEAEHKLSTGSAALFESILENTQHDDLVVFPNPSQGIFTIQLNEEYPLKDEKCELFVRDMAGKTLYNKKIDNLVDDRDYSVNLNFLPKGIYFIALRSGIFLSTAKIILN
jgi:hypothetical protein